MILIRDSLKQGKHIGGGSRDVQYQLSDRQTTKHKNRSFFLRFFFIIVL